MRAITVKQPWAWAIATGAKTVENRGRAVPWTSAIGQRIAIHAGKGWDEHGAYDDRIAHAHGVRLGLPMAVHPMRNPDYFDFGAVIATALLADVHGLGGCCKDPWADPGAWHLVLRDITPLREPVPCRGYQGLWSLPTDVDAAVQRQTGAAA